MPQLVLVLGRLQQLVNTTKQLQQQQQAAANGTAGTLGLQLSTHEDALQCEQLQLWLLLLQQDLLALPAGVSQLQPPQLTAAAHQLLQLALYGSTADTALELSPGFTTSEQAAAAAALTLLASWPHPTAAAPAPGFKLSASAHAASASDGLIALSSCAGQLLQLLQGPGTAAAAAGDRGALDAAAGSDSAALQSRAVALLGQLAGSSSAAAWQVLQWMQPLVLQHVRQSNWVRVVQQLLRQVHATVVGVCVAAVIQCCAYSVNAVQSW
jgi:hypothetical protein